MIMRKILFLFMLFTALTCMAQIERQDKVSYFCQVVYSPSYQYIYLPEEKLPKSLVDKDGELLKFNNITHVLNYMSSLGWDIFNIFKSEAGFTEVIFVKKIIDKDKAKEGLFFDDYPYKKKKK